MSSATMARWSTPRVCIRLLECSEPAVPAKAGTPFTGSRSISSTKTKLGPRFRGDDGSFRGDDGSFSGDNDSFLHQECLYRVDEARRIVAGDIVAGVHFHYLQPRIGGAHLGRGFGRVHVRACAAQRQDRALHLADQLPHVDAQLRALAFLDQALELLAE